MSEARGTAHARRAGCVSCAWHGAYGDICYCPEVVEAGRAAQLDLFDATPWWDVARCAVTGKPYRRLRLRGRVGGCEHWRWVKDMEAVT